MVEAAATGQQAQHQQWLPRTQPLLQPLIIGAAGLGYVGIRHLDHCRRMQHRSYLRLIGIALDKTHDQFSPFP
ncbi:hypothetical protein D3C80_1721010 [compost metagenome]